MYRASDIKPTSVFNGYHQVMLFFLISFIKIITTAIQTHTHTHKYLTFNSLFYFVKLQRKTLCILNVT